MTTKRIDMNHGFMKIIIKNQVDRDRYNKEVSEERQGKKQKSPSGASSLPGTKKPEAAIYRPPPKIVQPNPASSSTSLFVLEFEDEAGLVHTTMVSKSDTPQTAARRIASLINLPESLEQALSIRLQREFDCRLCE